MGGEEEEETVTVAQRTTIFIWSLAAIKSASTATAKDRMRQNSIGQGSLRGGGFSYRDGTGVAFVVVLNEGCLGGKAGRDRLRLRCEYHGQPCRQLRPGDHHTESVVPRIEGGLARRRAASTRQDPTDQQR